MYKDVTPRQFDLAQHKRSLKQPTDMQRAFKQAEIDALRKKCKEIEDKIVGLCRRNAAPRTITKWQQSADYHRNLLAQKEAA